MFRSIFKRRKADHQGEPRKRGYSAVPVSASKGATSQADSATPLNITVDETMVALSRELSGLARLDAGQAAKERGWATLQRELERRPVRPAASVAKDTGTRSAVRVGAGPSGRTARSGGLRWALGSAAAAVAVIAVLLGTYAGGLLQTADNGDPATTLTSVVSSDSTEPTTVPTDETTVTTQSPDSTTPTGGTTVTTEGPVTTVGPVTTDGPVTTQSPGTTNGTTGTTKSPTTTQPAQTTTTTGEQQLAAAQRERTAKAAVFALGSMVVDYFVTGDMSGARALVASGAQFSLVQMISSLNDPNGYRWISTKVLTGDTVRITLEFSDRVPNGQGELVEVVKRFRITVRVGDESAVITAISAGS